MTTLLLVRHGETDAVKGSLTGWKAGFHLNNTGREQARRLAQCLSELKVNAIYTSPLERAVETATIIGEPHGLSPTVREQLGDLRFGEWEERTFEELRRDPRWERFNSKRSLIRAPGGELMIEVQARMVDEVETLRERHVNETVAVVSHLDPLRSLIAHYLGIPLDFLLRFELNVGSVSVVRHFEEQPHVICLNQTGGLPV
jgi:broad specificity phosphatase PhoE